MERNIEMEAELQRCMDAYEHGQLIEPLEPVTEAETKEETSE